MMMMKKKKKNRFSKRSASDALFRSVELRIKSGCDFFNKKERRFLCVLSSFGCIAPGLDLFFKVI